MQKGKIIGQHLYQKQKKRTRAPEDNLWELEKIANVGNSELKIDEYDVHENTNKKEYQLQM